MSTLEKLTQQINTCTKCPLHTTRTHAVPGYGSNTPHIMLIGEAPGAEEDATGHPFVGRSGQVLQDMFRRSGLTREMVYIANTVKCRPPGNRDPLPEEKTTCAPYLAEQIELLDPTLIVTLGRVSMERFIVGESITKIHGKLYQSLMPDELVTKTDKKVTRHVYPVYHPSYALRRTESYEALVADFTVIPDIIKHIIREKHASR